MRCVSWKLEVEVEDAEVGLGEDCEDAVSNVGNNADLYTANQERRTSTA